MRGSVSRLAAASSRKREFHGQSFVRTQAPEPSPGRDERGEPPSPRPRSGHTDQSWRGRNHRNGHLRADGGGSTRQGGPGTHPLVRRGRHRLRLRRPLLRGIRFNGPRRRLGIYVRLRDDGRALRMDHRMGPCSGIRGRLIDRRPWLVGAFQGPPRQFRNTHTSIPEYGSV